MNITKKDEANIKDYDAKIQQLKNERQAYISKAKQRYIHIQHFSQAVTQIFYKMKYNAKFNQKMTYVTFKSLVKRIQNNMKISNNVYAQIIMENQNKFKHYKKIKVPVLPKVNAQANYNKFCNYEITGLDNQIKQCKKNLHDSQLCFLVYPCDSKVMKLSQPTNHKEQTKVLNLLKAILKKNPDYKTINATIHYLAHIRYCNKSNCPTLTGNAIMHNHHIKPRVKILKQLAQDFLKIDMDKILTSDASKIKMDNEALSSIKHNIKILNKSKLNYVSAFQANSPLNMTLPMATWIPIAEMPTIDYRYHDYNLKLLNNSRVVKIINQLLHYNRLTNKEETELQEKNEKKMNKLFSSDYIITPGEDREYPGMMADICNGIKKIL